MSRGGWAQQEPAPVPAEHTCIPAGVMLLRGLSPRRRDVALGASGRWHFQGCPRGTTWVGDARWTSPVLRVCLLSHAHCGQGLFLSGVCKLFLVPFKGLGCIG